MIKSELERFQVRIVLKTEKTTESQNCYLADRREGGSIECRKNRSTRFLDPICIMSSSDSIGRAPSRVMPRNIKWLFLNSYHPKVFSRCVYADPHSSFPELSYNVLSFTVKIQMLLGSPG